MNSELIKVGIVIGLLTAIGWFCYSAGSNSVLADWNAEKAALNQKTAEAFQLLIQQHNQTERELSVKEAEAWGRYQDAEVENERLNRELAERPWRVRIERPSCPVSHDTGTTSMGNGATEEYAELSREVARRITVIGREADQCEAKLKAMQDYVSLVRAKALQH